MLKPPSISLLLSVLASGAHAQLPDRAFYLDCLKTRVVTTTDAGVERKAWTQEDRSQFKIDLGDGVIIRAGERPAQWKITRSSDMDIDASMQGGSAIWTLRLNRISGELVETNFVPGKNTTIVSGYYACRVAVPAF